MNLCTPVYYAYSVRSLSLSFVTEVFELRQSGEIWQIGRQRIPDRWSDETEKAFTERFKITSRNLQKLLA